MGDIARRGNRLTKGINYDKAYVKSRSLVKDVYDAVAPKHSLGQKGKPHSSKEGRAASLGRTVRDVGKILSPERVKKFGGGRTNLLEQLGRVEAEPSNPNRRAEISRVHGELNRGYAKGGVVRRAKKFKTHGKDVPTMAAEGGRAGHAIGSLVHAATKAAKKYHKKKKLAEDTKKGKFPETESLTHQKGPYVGDVGSERPGIKRREWGQRPGQKKPDREHVPYERHGAKKGGKADKKWIQKAVNPKHKGYCTPMTKKTCTPARKALARTFKKKAKTGW